ncbi:MAG: PQQ-binding-like beta-propeller repeat protein [Planctomyces sp.]|nr:PQQ-binding-like beta-propeller repeat protein [Planctomyces sp.]
MSPFIERLGWVLIHSLWQFAVLAAAAYLIQRSMRRASSDSRYIGLLLVLSLVLLVPLVTWVLVPETVTAPVTVVAEPNVTASVQLPQPAAATSFVNSQAAAAVDPAVTETTIIPDEQVETAPPLIVASPSAPQGKPMWERLQIVLKPWLATIVLGWSIGVLAFAIRPVWSLFTIRRLRRQGTSPVPDSVRTVLERTAKQLGVRYAVDVLQSAVVQVPIVAGYLKPVILLPVSVVSGLPASQLEAILAHELAHIRRHDYLVNLIQTLIETVCFYHPGIWWLSHQIRCEREHCCDDIAVGALGSRLNYSRALLALEEMRVTQTPLAVGANGGSLLARVRRLFHLEPTSSSVSQGGVAVVASLIACAMTMSVIATARSSSPEAGDQKISLQDSTADETSWPQLGGSASHNPVSLATGLPTQFDLNTRQNIRWSSEIGSWSYSSPVVADGRVLIGTNNAQGRDSRFPSAVDMACLQCFDEATGEFLWQYSSPRMEQGRRHDWPEISICSIPVVEGDRVWFATNRCEVVCLDLNGHRDGEDDGPYPDSGTGSAPDSAIHQADIIWKLDLFNSLGIRPLNATCVSPTLAGNMLLLNSPNDVDESYQNLAAPNAPAFLALEKSTGQLIWTDKTPNPNILGNGCSMGAPAVSLIDGTWQAIFAGYDGWLYSFELDAIQRGETRLLWKFDLNPKESLYSLGGPRSRDPLSGNSYRGIAITPVVVGDRVYSAVGHNPERGDGLGRLWCIDATKRGDISADLVYNKSAPDVVIPHKRIQACEPDKGDFTRPNPNSGVVWVYTGEDLNGNGELEFEEQMHLSNSLSAVHDGLLMTTDLSGQFHCLDAITGKPLWTHDLMAPCYSGPLIADGKAWMIDEDGDLSIFAVARQKQLLAEITMSTSGYTNLAAANQSLYVATKTHLVAISAETVFPEAARGPRLELQNSDGSRWQGTLVEGNVGFIPPNPSAWNSWSGHDQRIDLSQLSTGKHLLITQFPWSVMQVEIPLVNSLRQPLRLGVPPRQHSSSNYAAELTVRADELGRQFIDCDLYNHTDEQWSFSELDLSIEAGWLGQESEAHSPLWLNDDLTQVKRIEIPPGGKGTLQIDWPEWAKQGIWDPMAGPGVVSKPTLPERQPGKIWVRISGPGFGTAPVSVTHPDQLPLGDSVTLPDGSVLELVGITTPPIQVKLQDERTWWQPNGSIFPEPVANPKNLGVGNDRVDGRQAFLRLTSRERDASMSIRSLELKGWSSAAVSSSPIPDSESMQISEIYVFGPVGDAKSTSLEVQVATAPWSIWKYDLTGKPLDSPAVGEPLLSMRNAVEVLRAGPSEDGIAIWTRPFSSTTDEGELRLIAVDKTGNQRYSNRSSGDGQEDFRWFRLNPDEFSHFELRIRPFGPKVRFENVSLQPGNQTEPKISLELIDAENGSVDVSDKPVAQPPAPEEDHPRVELVGLTWDKAPKLDAWHPNGQPMVQPEWAKMIPELGPAEKKAPGAAIFLYEFHGLRERPSIYFHHRVAYQSGDELFTTDRSWRRAILYEDVMVRGLPSWGSSPGLSLSDEPWGPWKKVSKEGQLSEGGDHDQTYRLGYDRITFRGKRNLTQSPLNSEPLPSTATMAVVLQQPQDFENLYAIEVEGVLVGEGPESQGYQQIVPRFFVRFRNESTKEWHYEIDWPYNPEEVDHLRFRIRPYRHQYVFENTAFAPSQKPDRSTEFRTVYTKLEHDLSKPEARSEPPSDVEFQVVDAESGDAVPGASVLLRNTISSWQPDGRKSPPVEPALIQLQTDPQGRFSVSIPEQLRNWQSDFQVSVRHPDYLIEQSFGAWQVTPEMARDPALMKEKFFSSGMIRLDRGQEITGQVLGPDGQPAKGVKLYAAMQMPEYLNMPPHAVTDSSGLYRFRVPGRDEHLLFVIPEDAVAVSVPIRKGYGQQPVVRLESGTAIKGRVFDAEGKSQAGVVVQANGGDSVYDGFDKPMARVRTDAEGRYRLPPQRLPVDVRVTSLGWVGGWEERGRDLTLNEVYLPTIVRTPDADTTTSIDPQQSNTVRGSVRTLDFRPCETVTLTAMVYDENGQPANDCEVALFGIVPDPETRDDERGSSWRGRFQSVPDMPGQFHVKAPKGIKDATLVQPEIPTGPRQNWSRAVREGEKFDGSRTDSGWPVLDRDDNSIVVGAPAVAALTPPATGPEQRTFPTRFADALVTSLRTRATRVLSGPQPYMSQELFEEVRRNTIAFLTTSLKVDPPVDRQQAIIDSMRQRITDPNAPGYSRYSMFESYLRFGNAYKDLMWRVYHAANRIELTSEESTRLEAQREVVRQRLRTVPVGADAAAQEKANAALALLNALMSDPLWVVWQTPFSEEEWPKVADRINNSGGGWDNVSRVLELFSPGIPWPDRIVGSAGSVGNLSHEFASEEIFLGATENLGSTEHENSPGVIDLDQAKLLSWPTADVPDLAALLQRVKEHGHGDIGYSPSRDELVAFRGGRLLKLETNDWWIADQISDDELRARIEKGGASSISMSEYPKDGFRSQNQSPSLIAIRTGPFADQGQLFVFAVDASDTGMYVHIRPRPILNRSLDLLSLPAAMRVPLGPARQGLRTSLTLADERIDPVYLYRGRVLINVDLFNGSDRPQVVAFDPALASNSFDVYGPDGQLITGLVGQMPVVVQRDDQGRVIPRVVQPGKSIRLLEDFNLGLACPLEQVGQYRITFGGQEGTLNLGNYGRSYPPSNMLTLDVAPGSVPPIHQVWKLFREQPIDSDSEQFRTWWQLEMQNPSVWDSHTLVFRRGDYEGIHFIWLKFTESADSSSVNVPGISGMPTLPPSRSVLLGRTRFGYAHLIVCENADREWPDCEQKMRMQLEKWFIAPEVPGTTNPVPKYPELNHNPELRAEVKLKGESSANSNVLTAELWQDAKLELLGVRNTAIPPVAWLPNGAPTVKVKGLQPVTVNGIPADWPRPLRVQGENASHDFILRATGLNENHGLIWDKVNAQMPLTTPVFTEAPGLFSVSGALHGQQRASIRVGVTSEWGPWQSVNADGSVGSQVPLELHQTGTYHEVESFLVLGDMTVLKGVFGDLDIDYEITAVDKSGNRHSRRGVGIWKEGETQAPFFDLKSIELDHWEYRLREVVRWVTFRDIALAPKDSEVTNETPQPGVDVEHLSALRYWRARGRVTDSSGRPLSGVNVRAATGMGSLRSGYGDVTDADGRYDFRFGGGMTIGGTEVANIFADLAGHFEQNLCRQGNGMGSIKAVDKAVAKEWGMNSDQIVLPGKPREVDFVMIPAAKTSGTLVDDKDQPLQGYSVMLTGETLPPGASVIAQVKTDENGRFQISEIPTTFPFQFEVRKPTAELAPPWDDTWASGPITFSPPGENDVVAQQGKTRFTATELRLKILGDGVHGRKAVEESRNAPIQIQPNSPTAAVVRKGDEILISDSVMTWVLSNKESDSPSLEVPSETDR